MTDDTTYRWIQEPDEPENIVEPEPDYWYSLDSVHYPPDTKDN